jgi:hypothetical protein
MLHICGRWVQEIIERVWTGIDWVHIPVCAIWETDCGDVQVCGEGLDRPLPRALGCKAFTISVSSHFCRPGDRAVDKYMINSYMIGGKQYPCYPLKIKYSQNNNDPKTTQNPVRPQSPSAHHSCLLAVRHRYRRRECSAMELGLGTHGRT